MSEFKPSNPKDAVAIGKVPVSTISGQVLSEVELNLGRPISPRVVGEVGLGMMEGALKYGRHNYRGCGVRASVYFDAAWRHRAAFESGQDIDPDSGLHHVVKEIACLTVLRDSMLQGNWVDDRPPKAAHRRAGPTLSRWWEGEDYNDLHFSLVTERIAELVVLREFIHAGVWVDERPKKDAALDWMLDLNAKAKALIEKYPNPKPALTEVV